MKASRIKKMRPMISPIQIIRTMTVAIWGIPAISGCFVALIVASRYGVANTNKDGGNNKPNSMTINRHHQYTICVYINNSILRDSWTN